VASWPEVREFFGILATPARSAVDSFRLRWKVRRSEYQRDEADRKYAARIAALRAKNAPREEIDQFESEAASEHFSLDETARQLRGRILILEAHRLLLPVPDSRDKEAWEEATYAGGKVLTAEAERKLRAAIRAEAREKWESSRLWVSGLTGLVGALAALLALLLGKG
jgi:hypothetical protein